MNQRRRQLIARVIAGLLVVTLVLVIRNQLRVSRNRASRRAAHVQELERAETTRRIRRALFEMLQPVALANCRLERFGEAHDGGYLLCANLLEGAEAGYSYGIAGYDKWGCDLSSKRRIKVHEYDCFNTTKPACPGGDTVFHAECVAGKTMTEEGRRFDTLQNQIARNGDAARRVVLKIDVEGAEWETFLHAPDEVLGRIDQIVVEFHHVDQEQYVDVVQRLKRFFFVAHIHFNNFGCDPGVDPFPSWAYEVLLVNRRLGVLDSAGKAGGMQPLDAPNNPAAADCQIRTVTKPPP